MNTKRFQVEPLRNAKSFERTDIVTRPFYGATRSQGSSPFRVLAATTFIVGLGFLIAMQMGKR